MAIKVSIKKTSVAARLPTSSDLIEGQLAVNFADKRLFTEDGSGNILELGTNPSSLTTGAITASGTVTFNGSLVSAAVAFTGGTIDGTVIGGSTPAAITGTTITGTSLVGPLTGNSTGTHTGAVTGDVTGNITGSGSSTLTTLAVTNFTAGGLTYPTADGGANTVLATNGSGALSFISVSGAYDLASQSEAEAGTETGGRIFSPLRVKQAIDALGLTNVVSDTTPQLGGDLDGQGKDITDIGVLTKDTAAPIYGSSSSPIVLTVTVASKTAAHAYNGDGSSNGYFINGVEAPAIELGGSDAATANTEYVYKFDQSDSSNSGHPLVFYLDAAKATAYTTGVTTSGTPGSSGAYTQIAVDSETPKILYYQCSSHAYMGNYAVVPASLSFSAGTLRIAGTAVSSTGAELNVLDGIPGTLTSTELGYVDGVTSSIQTQIDNISVTNGTLTKTFTAGETATVTLTSNVLVPSVAVTKEVAQSGSTNNDWLVNSSSENYTRYNSAAATTLTFSGFDLSTATYNSVEFDTSGQISAEAGFAFNADGTSFYISDSSAGDVNQYNMSTAFDISTASYASTFSTSSQDTAPKGVAFNTDGTKMFIAASSSSQVYLYTLSTGFDISTASYTSAYNSSSTTSNPSEITFNPDGTFMYLVQRSGGKIHQYTLTTGFDISTASYTREFDASSRESSPEALRFNGDGTEMYVLGEGSDNVRQYNLSTAYNISTASTPASGGNFYVGSQENDPKGLAFDNVGGKMFVVGANGSAVVEYDLTVKLTLGSGSFASADVGKRIEANSGVFLLTATTGTFTTLTSPTNFNQVASGSWQMYGLQFNSTDGDLELAGRVSLDVSAATHNDTFDIEQSEGNPNGITFNPDGTKMYVIGYSQDKILQYTLTTGFDLTTASYASKYISVSGQDDTPGGLALNSDGTKIFFAGDQSNKVWQYTMSTAYDISTASSTGSVSVSSQSTAPNGLAFNNDGTAMYVCDPDENDIFQYTLTTAYDISTASYASKYFYVNNEETYIADLAFNEDGTKMYIVGHTNYIHEYDLSTAFDVSTASYNNKEFNASSQNAELSGIFATTNAIGKIFIVGRGDDHVDEYSILSANYPTTGYHAAHTNTSTDSTYWTDINSMTASESAGSGSIYYCVSTDDRTTWKIAKGTDGERSIVRNNSGTWQYNSNGTYGSTTWANASVNAELYAIQEAMTGATGGYSIDNLSFVDSFSVSSQESAVAGVAFNTDGTKMFICGYNGSEVNEYALSTGFDVSTASYTRNFSVSSQDGFPYGITFNTNGAKMFIVGASGKDVNEYALTTGFDISTASYTQNFSVSSQDTSPRDIKFNSDGTKMFIVGKTGSDVNEYTLSTGFDVSTASFVDSFSVSSQDANPHGVAFNSDGTKMFVSGFANDKIYEYSLSTGFDVSTASFVTSASVSSQDTSPQAIAFSADGTKLFVVGGAGADINEYNTPSYVNQMNKTQLDAIPDANHFTLANDLDLAIIMTQGSGATSLPSSDGVAINYDAAVLNQGAIHGTDYTFDAPAQNKVRLTSVNAANLKVRIV